MRDLHLIGVQQDGEYLMLVSASGQEQYRLRIDDTLRAALRFERPAHPSTPQVTEPLPPREIQAMIRAGASAEEAAERAGWTVEKVHRYEGPIIAERAHMAGLASRAYLRRGGAGHGPTLAERVNERLVARGVDPESADWDSWRSEDGQWTVEVTFIAGGRPRVASWRFDRGSNTVQARDDEARWLGEDEHPEDVAPAPTPPRGARPGTETRVYDVEAEGGLTESPAAPERTSDGTASHPSDEDGDLELMTSMRARSGARKRRRGATTTRRAGTPAGRPADPPAVLPTSIPGMPGPADEAADHDEHVAPLEPLDYDPEIMPPPPGAHSDPEPDGIDGQPLPPARAPRARGAARRPAAKTPASAPPAVAETTNPPGDPAPLATAPASTSEEKSTSGEGASPAPADAETSAQALASADAAPETASTAPAAPPARPRTRARASRKPIPAADVALAEPESSPAVEEAASPPAVEEAASPPAAASGGAPAASGRSRAPRGPESAANDQVPTGAGAADAPADPPAESARPKPAPPKGRKGRASVPKWDDIVFGAKPSAEE